MSVLQIPTANFAKLNLNVPKFNPSSVSTPVVTPVSLPVVTPVVATPVAVPVSTPVSTPVVSVPTPAAPTTFLMVMDDNNKAPVSQSTQEQQYKIAGFSFKEPRVKTALIEATVDKNLQRTLDNIETAKGGFNGQGSIPLDRLSNEDQAVIELARKSYNDLVRSRSTAGVQQFEKELKAWNELKTLGPDGKETNQLVPSYTKVLRDVFTLDFKNSVDVERVLGTAESKTGIKAWTKNHKTNQDKLNIRCRRQDLKLVVEFTFNQDKPAVSDALVQDFQNWLAVNGAGASATYQRVTAEYKKKVSLDRKTKTLVEQEKKKPTPSAADPISGSDQWASAYFMVNRLRNRFSDELHVATTVFIDYLVQQFSQVAIMKCREDKKSRVMIKHVLENTKEIELFPLVSNFRSYQNAALRYLSSANKGKLTSTAAATEDDDENKGKHPFSYCVYGVCKQLTKELHEKYPTGGYEKILISSEFKQFMCELVDELVQMIGPILRQEIASHDVKTVNINTFYSVLGVLLSWHRVNFVEVKKYIEDRVERYKTYTGTRAEERRADRDKGVNPNSDETEVLPSA